MRVLLDNNVPVGLTVHLAEVHDVSHVRDFGWQPLQNGELVAAAESKFDVLVTVDRNMEFQTNISHLRLMVVVVRAQSNRLADLLPKVNAVQAALLTHKPGTYVVVS